MPVSPTTCVVFRCALPLKGRRHVQSLQANTFYFRRLQEFLFLLPSLSFVSSSIKYKIHTKPGGLSTCAFVLVTWLCRNVRTFLSQILRSGEWLALALNPRLSCITTRPNTTKSAFNSIPSNVQACHVFTCRRALIHPCYATK